MNLDVAPLGSTQACVASPDDVMKALSGAFWEKLFAGDDDAAAASSATAIPAEARVRILMGPPVRGERLSPHSQDRESDFMSARERLEPGVQPLTHRGVMREV